MKVLLINPPRSFENKILEYAPAEAKKYVHKKLIGPPLGLLTIAASVKDISDVTFIDLKGEYDLHPDSPSLEVLVEKYVKKYDPDILGVTFIASEFYFGIEIFKTAKKVNPEVLTVAGGLHTTLCPQDFNDPAVDVVCPGQSAKMFQDIVNARSKGINLETVAGIYINKNGILSFTRAIDYSWNSAKENFIMPDRSYLKRWISTYVTGQATEPSTYLFTSLGCPYKCTFCSIWPQFNGEYLMRDIESIIDELKSLDDYHFVRFSDGNTIVNVDYINKLFDRIIEENIKKFLIMDIRFDTAVKYPELIEKLAKCGLKVVICGFESFRDEELEKYNKSSSAHLIEKAIDVFHQNGVMLRGNYVIPPDYSEDDFNALEEYASKFKVTFAGYSILTPMPGTVFYNEVKDEIIDFDLSKYNFFNCVLKTKLPLEKFYERAGKLWLIKKGTDLI